MGPEEDCELVGGAYGLIDAPSLWYREFRKALMSLGFQQCPLDPCVFSLTSRNESGKPTCHGVLGIHFDNGIGGGSSCWPQQPPLFSSPSTGEWRPRQYGSRNPRPR